MGAATVFFTNEREKGHALDTALDDWGADSGDHLDLVLHALRHRALCGLFTGNPLPQGKR
ncbi:hypothetical protein [Pseudomonas guariconensis]|uniref:hypothetical protein n=1 Tax=Pseudomonas guariconensis TaxID=1288410 RepID=UPI0018AB9535|nr:hypothetical protein [Pseudomonas guariconensis]MBF8754862.1 hypothetical protein [Pseudomonas guariconensis]